MAKSPAPIQGANEEWAGFLRPFRAKAKPSPFGQPWFSSYLLVTLWKSTRNKTTAAKAMHWIDPKINTISHRHIYVGQKPEISGKIPTHGIPGKFDHLSRFKIKMTKTPYKTSIGSHIAKNMPTT
jgi:hypothetical protein